MSVTVVLVHPHEASHEGLALLLERAGATVVAAVGLDRDTVEIIERVRPDAVPGAIGDDGGDPLEPAELLRRPATSPSVLLPVADQNAPGSGEALGDGVRCIALERADVDDLLDLLSSAAGRPPAEPAFRADLLEAVAPTPTRARSILSRREGEILELLSHGLTGESIARELVLSSETIKTHIRNAMLKLEATTRVHAIAIAIRSGYISGADGQDAGAVIAGPGAPAPPEGRSPPLVT